MSIAEKLAKLTVGKNSGYGARPSKLQLQVMDRTHKSIDEVESIKRKMIRRLKKEAENKGEVYKHNPPLIAACPGSKPAANSGFTREEMLAGMRGLDPTSAAYLFYHYSGDRGSYKKALQGIYRLAWNLHLERGWKTQETDEFREIVLNMCVLAIFELSDPKCPKCCGTKCGRNGGTCRRCQGKGKLRMAGTYRAEQIGVNYHAYRKTYVRRLDAIRQMIFALGTDALATVSENIMG